jgi:hypothetical protein
MANADATRVGIDRYYSFWLSPLAAGVYVTAAIGVSCLICGFFNIRLTRGNFILGEPDLRRIAENSAAPGYTGAERIVNATNGPDLPA